MYYFMTQNVYNQRNLIKWTKLLIFDSQGIPLYFNYNMYSFKVVFIHIMVAKKIRFK